ncbi:MAG: hypothetical protein PHR35_08130 [Kiritimatiellae bacterium]|nr:hypothetical protein [Kiritimatiellia bacterium]
MYMLSWLLCIAALAAPAVAAVAATGTVSQAASASASAPMWTNRVEVTPSEALADFPATWTGRELPLQLSDPSGKRVLRCDLRTRRSSLMGTPTGVFDTAFTGGVRVTAMLTPATNLVTVALRRSRQVCTLYVDGQPALAFADRWEGPLLVATPADALPDGESEGYVQRLGDFSFADDFMVPENVTNTLENWELLAGEWRMHAVTGNVSGTLPPALGGYPTPERSPNFYCLEGHGTQAMAVAGESFQNHYTVRAAVQHNAGTNGLLFLMTEGGTGHAFTVHTDARTGRLTFGLWRGCAPGRGLGRFVEGAETTLLPGQWLMLEARIFDDHVICLVDNVEVIRRRLAFPPGGRFGLFSDAPDGTRFDDVAAWTHADMSLDSPADVALWRRRGQGAADLLEGPLPGVATAAPEIPFPARAHWRKRAGVAPFELIVGATSDPPTRLDVALAPKGGTWQAALLAGWSGTRQPHFRMVCSQTGPQRELRLEEVRSDGTNRLDAIALAADDGIVTLSLDTTRAGEIRGSINGHLALWHEVPSPPHGAGGIWLSRDTDVELTPPLFRSRPPLLTDRFEKNPLYVTDPFMRHWASPEGQWLPYPDGRAWYKSDVLHEVGVRLPAVANSRLHLAVPEGQSNGTLQVAITNDSIALCTRAAGQTSLTARCAIPLTALPETKSDDKGATVRYYEARMSGHLFLLLCDTGVLARCQVPVPYPGRRMLVQGFTAEQLHLSRVLRSPVLDCLFTESLHDWNINGGVWEIVNRFQCTPTWSNMTGENGSSLAALWSKYEIAGDFSIEMNAGMRHGWYERPGDLNLTIMNARESTGDGYTITCTGWDPDESQLWTRLFRNGQLLQATDRYAAPRVREGSQRRGYEPLLAGGRDVHGAWYTLRLSRAGGRLRFDFDNETLLDVNDPEPLPRGSFGLWTYMNSMVVARARVTADTIRPRAFARRRITRLPAPPPPPATVAAPSLRVNGLPAELLDETCWKADDGVSRPVLEFSRQGQRPEMRVTASQGGGTLLARARFDPVPVSRLLGWRFEVARAADARFNFEYALGTGDKDSFKPVACYTHRICGSDEARGPRRLAGSLEREPPPSPSRDDRLAWTPVTVWLPVDRPAKATNAIVEGFGNLQSSDVQQGLCGNPPDTWYAVRNFRPIFLGAPELTAGADADLTTCRTALAAGVAGRLNTLALPSHLDPRQPVVEWGLMPAAEAGLRVAVSSRPPWSLRVASTLPWPNALLPPRSVTVNARPVASSWIEDNELVIPLPRTPFATNEPVRLDLGLGDGRPFTQLLSDAQMSALRAAQAALPPVLVALALPDGDACYQNFEGRDVLPGAFQASQPPQIMFDDVGQQTYLRFANRGSASCLRGILAQSYNLLSWPVLQFRYRGDPMARVSLQAGAYGVISFAEQHPQAVGVRLAGTTSLDRAWHTWIGMPADAIGPRQIYTGYALTPVNITVGSCKGPDQTGRYSTLDVDELAAGPAVSERRPLSFLARCHAPDGVAGLAFALAPGPAPWRLRGRGVQDAANWQTASTGTWVSVATGVLPEGVHHLVVRARGHRGDWSEPADVPILVDREPVVMSSSVAGAPGRLNGTVLNLSFATGVGALPDFDKMTVTCNGAPISLLQDAQGTVSYRPDGVFFEMDWPLLLRRQIQAAGDGAGFKLRFDQVVDAAGNPSPAHECSVTVSYAADKTPPALLPPALNTNFLWLAGSMSGPNDFYSHASQVQAAVEPAGEYKALTLRPGGKQAFTRRSFAPHWNTASFPWLALSLRLAPGAAAPSGQTLFELRCRLSGAPATARKPANGASYALAFPFAPTAGVDVVHGKPNWEPGRWNDFMVDARTFLRNETGVTNDLVVSDLDLAFPENATNALQVRAAAVMAPWTAADVVPFRAYDASGVAGIFWQGGGQTPLTVLRPARVTLPPEDNLWMKIFIRDRAGNAMPPVMLPIPPDSVKAPANLPLAEDWNI